MVEALTYPKESPVGYSHDASLLAEARDYIELLKPRVMSLVVFTGFVGLLAAPGQIHFIGGIIAICCIAMGSGAAGCINMWYEHDLDSLMERTRKRPIPQGRIAPAEALSFGIIIAVFSVLIMAFGVNYIAAGLLLAAILFYVGIYTVWLKRRTPQNIVIGGAAGAFPPMIGWTAVTGNIAYESIILFGIIFLWTPPHFWALSLYACKDYAKAGVPMMPVVKGEKHTRGLIMLYTLAMVPFTFMPNILGFAGLFYGVIAAALGAGFLFFAFSVWQEKMGDYKQARFLFGYSIVYLFLLFLAFAVDAYLI